MRILCFCVRKFGIILVIYIVFFFLTCALLYSAFFRYFVSYFVYLYDNVFLHFVFLCFGVLIFEYFEILYFCMCLHFAYVQVRTGYLHIVVMLS